MICWYGEKLPALSPKIAALAVAMDRETSMVHERQLAVLLYCCMKHYPKRIFEFGTYKGATTNMILEVLPECEVTSIAYVGKEYNNSGLSLKDVGCLVSKKNRARLTQLIGDSHKLKDADFEKFDLIFIDGDHTYSGVEKDTNLAFKMIKDGGVILWHDINMNKKKKYKYPEVTEYLMQASFPVFVYGDCNGIGFHIAGGDRHDNRK